MRNPTRLAAAVAFAVLAVLAMPTPASAGALPPGQQITVLDPASGNVYSANPATAALTLVATGSPWAVSQTPTALDVDDSGHGFLVTVDERTPHLLGISTLWKFDATTGQASAPIPITVVDGTTASAGFACQGLDLRSDGVPVVSCLAALGSTVNITGPVDPTTGVMPGSSPDSVLFTVVGSELLTAYAVSPVTAVPFSFQWDATDPSLDEVLYNASFPHPGLYSTVPLSGPVWAADFDRDGQLFVTTEDASHLPVLATWIR